MPTKELTPQMAEIVDIVQGYIPYQARIFIICYMALTQKYKFKLMRLIVYFMHLFCHVITPTPNHQHQSNKQGLLHSWFI